MKPRLMFFISLIVLGVLVATAGYLLEVSRRQLTLVSFTSREVVHLGERTVLTFTIENYETIDRNYTYFVHLDSPSGRVFEFNDTVWIPRGRRFTYDLTITPRVGGDLVATINVYKGEEMILVEDLTYHVKLEKNGREDECSPLQLAFNEYVCVAHRVCWNHLVFDASVGLEDEDRRVPLNFMAL